MFERVASDVVLGALDGVNGTVFAYGQTGSGKTFTVTGGAARYADRGIIPRAIALVFAELRRRSDHTYSVRAVVRWFTAPMPCLEAWPGLTPRRTAG